MCGDLTVGGGLPFRTWRDTSLRVKCGAVPHEKNEGGLCRRQPLEFSLDKSPEASLDQPQYKVKL